MRRHFKQRAGLVGFFALGATLAAAQDAAEPLERPSTNTMILVTPGGPQIGMAANFVAGEARVVGAAVTGKPYSADSITETIQVLGDGNRIVNTHASRVYRDSDGRTRLEQTLARAGAWPADEQPVTMITIDDPVEKVSYFINPREETVRTLRPFRFDLSGEPQGGRAVFLGPGPAIAGAGVAAEGITGTITATRMPNVGIQRADTETESEPAAFPAAPLPFDAAFSPLAASVQGRVLIAGDSSASMRTEDLGEQVLEGVLARGTRESRTIAAGEIGNERPIEIFTETWYSEEIEALISRRTYDPRFGETNYRLVNVTRDEPSPELFTVPHTYRVLNDGEPGSIIRGVLNGAAERTQRSLFIVRPGMNGGNGD